MPLLTPKSLHKVTLFKKEKPNTPKDSNSNTENKTVENDKETHKKAHHLVHNSDLMKHFSGFFCRILTSTSGKYI